MSPPKFFRKKRCYLTLKHPLKFLEMFMVSILIYLGCLIQLATRALNRNSSSQVTMLIEVSRVLRPYACCQHSRSNIRIISFYLEVTMSVKVSTECMDFMMSVSEDIMLKSGRSLDLPLMFFQFLLLSMTEFCACMVD